MGEQNLATPVKYLRGVGPVRAGYLAKLNIFTVGDLLWHFPRRYEDRSNLKPIAALAHGGVETVTGKVVGVGEIRPRRGLVITKVGITDGTGLVYALWFNQPYIKKQFRAGMNVIVSGKIERRFQEVQITDPEVEPVDGDDPLHTGRIVPVYPSVGDLPQRVLRGLIKQALDTFAGALPEIIPAEIRQRHGMVDRATALFQIHFPPDTAALEAARRRLAFDELFILQLGLALEKRGNQRKPGVRHRPDGDLAERFMAALPFTLTRDQGQVIGEIKRDMEQPVPMHRLVQGDVGSGKTVVAAAALVKTVESGYQGTMMAPTEILAEQHYHHLSGLLAPLGVRVGLLTGRLGKKEKDALLHAVAAGEIDILVGTHALIQEEVTFSRLGLVITDEQHRFGVRQRALLQQKGYNPDVLVMTATPIPRTLALTYYGDLDVSVIKELPPGRQPVKTRSVTPEMRLRVYKFIREQVQAGRQAYIVCPLVEESDKLAAQAATKMADRLREEVFPDLRVGLVHGRMGSLEKETVMKQFAGGETDVLVATTVIEVGVNVPNATVMVVEGAERFGLAQLHQLRGRVGRGTHQSFCILVCDGRGEDVDRRMKIMEETNDGFVLAEKDLELRGPGEFFGTRQHGLPDLKVANILRDLDLLELARREAMACIQNRELLAPALKEELCARFGPEHHMIFVS